MRIIITGTPGTGKTKIAAKLAKMLDIKLISIKDVVEQEKIFRVREGEKVVDTAVLDRVLKKALKNENDYVVEGHLACEVKMPCNYVFVLRTHPDELKKRLSGRRYSKEKLDGNLMSEMLDYCEQRVSRVYGKKPIEIDTTGATILDSARRIAEMIRNKKKKGDSVDYSGELLKHLRLTK